MITMFLIPVALRKLQTVGKTRLKLPLIRLLFILRWEHELNYWLYTRRTIVRRELGRTRANSRELGRTPREFASSSPTPTLRRTPPNVRRSTPNVRRSSAEFARVRPSSRVLRRELANSSPENSFAGRNPNHL